MGWTNVSDVRVGKHIEFVIEAGSEAEATEQVEQMAEKLFSNPVIEDFHVLATEDVAQS
jgi:phosphoribosylformylglycinamidine synthase